MGTKYISKMKTLKKNEIENNFQIEIMFSSSKIAIKIRGTKSKGERNWRIVVIFTRENTQIKVNERKNMRKKNNKSTPN
jgi:hypothetical protein